MRKLKQVRKTIQQTKILLKKNLSEDRINSGNRCYTLVHSILSSCCFVCVWKQFLMLTSKQERKKKIVYI